MFPCIGLLVLTGCERDLPFTYRYLSPAELQVNYQDSTYLLNRSSKLTNVPFTYDFEADGDVDIILDGIEYEIESPYDRDGSFKKKKKSKNRRSSRRR